MFREAIAAKLNPPLWLGEQIPRRHLLYRLNRVTEHRLTLIHAPAGYGKTSLLAHWREVLRNHAVDAAWLTLEPDDAELKRFAAYLLLTIQQANQVGSPRSRRRDGPPELPQRAALSAIIHALEARTGPFVLILDDFHRATGQPGDGAVAGMVAALLRLAPPHCHVVIASRDYPALGQAALAAEGQLLEITATDLRFSPAEAHSLLDRGDPEVSGTGVSLAEAEQILTRTEGWPIAVQMASLSLRRGGKHDTIGHFAGSGSDLARYLSEQVLLGLPEETRDLVMRTALPDRLSGELVDLLCGRSDGWMVLEGLEQQGVFLMAEGAERGEYRYHQLFAGFLRDRFMRAQRPLYLKLQQRLAKWFAARGEVSEAVSHAIHAGDTELVAATLEQAGGWRLIPRGQQQVLETGIAHLPAATVAARPVLVLAQVYLQIKQGELGAARARFDRLVAEGADGAGPDLRTELRVVGDTLLDYENQPLTLGDLLEREALLRRLPADDHLVLANISETLGAKYFEGGWLERALQPVLAAREHYQAIGSTYSDLFTRFLEARIKRAQGRAHEAAAILAEAWRIIAEQFGPRSDLAANCAAFQAELLLEQDRAGEARALLDWALPHMEQSDGWVDVYAAAYFTQARALAGEGDFTAAWATLDRARRTAARRRLHQLELLSGLAELDLRFASGESLELCEQRAEALELDRLADAMAEESPRYRPVIVAACLCRIKLALLAGDTEAAWRDLATLQHWAIQRGAGRLLIDVHLLSAAALQHRGDTGDASAAFDEAVAVAMFQDMYRPFVDLRQFTAPFITAALTAAQSQSGMTDRMRTQFLRHLSRRLAAFRTNLTLQGPFNEAEAEVLFYLSQGHSNKEIARQIGMSPDTVKYRLKALFRKLGTGKRTEAVRLAAERGLIPSNRAQ